MDCEQFDSTVMDLLYGELADDDMAAAAKRHVEGCDRCASLLGDLRSTRKAATLALVEPPAEMASVVLEAARKAQREVPLPRRFGRWLSWAGSYAMRPQLAMAALLMLMIGSSLLLIRGRPGSGHVGVVRVTEQGVPEREGPDVPITPDPGRLTDDEATPLPPRHLPEPGGAQRDRSERRAHGKAASDAAGLPAERVAESADADRLRGPAAKRGAMIPPTGDPSALQNFGNIQQQRASASPSAAPPPDGYAEAMALYEARDFANAYRAFDAIAMRGGASAASAALYAAKAVRASSGCITALPRFESTTSRYGGTGAALEARWEAASCARILGDLTRARIIYRELATIESQRERAERELSRISSQAAPPARSKAATGASNKNKPPSNHTGSQNTDTAH